MIIMYNNNNNLFKKAFAVSLHCLEFESISCSQLQNNNWLLCYNFYRINNTSKQSKQNKNRFDIRNSSNYGSVCQMVSMTIIIHANESLQNTNSILLLIRSKGIVPHFPLVIITIIVGIRYKIHRYLQSIRIII